jgi:2-polyprenyl-3-methyl-5-hydroxy-6-metoxy-1,4-benzoquinol methylase
MDALEHLEDPHAVLTAAADVLQNRGLLAQASFTASVAR